MRAEMGEKRPWQPVGKDAGAPFLWNVPGYESVSYHFYARKRKKGAAQLLSLDKWRKKYYTLIVW